MLHANRWTTGVCLHFVASLMLCLVLLTGRATAAPRLDAATRAHIVDKLARELASQHAVPGTGRRAASFLRRQHRSGAYNRWFYGEVGDACSLAAPFPSQLMAAV